MKYIAHRGNTEGRLESWENEPTYIDKAIKSGFDVEIDVWYIDSERFGKMLFLGHDKPIYGVEFQWFAERIKHIWIHCKNIEAVEFFANHEYDYNFFWHQEDTLTLTSQKYIWAYPGKQPIRKSIAVMPEINNDDISQCVGICSDYVKKYKNNK